MTAAIKHGIDNEQVKIREYSIVIVSLLANLDFTNTHTHTHISEYISAHLTNFQPALVPLGDKW